MEKEKVTKTNDQHNPYHYEVLQAKHANQAIKLISQVFCEQEPLTTYLGINHHEFIPFAKQIIDKAIVDGLSIVATHNNMMTACSIVEDFADPLNITIDIDPRFRFIFALLDHLGRDYFSQKDFDKGHLAHLFITAVDKDYQNKGLSKYVNAESIKLAQLKNYNFMCCEFTHHYNEHATLNHLNTNKLLIKSCDYKDFYHEGRKPFENLEGSANAYIWALRDDVKLCYRNKNNELVSAPLE